MATTLDPQLAIDAINRAPLGIVVLDATKQVRFLNAAMAALLEMPQPDSAIGMPITQISADLAKSIEGDEDVVDLHIGKKKRARTLKRWAEALGGDATIHYFLDATELYSVYQERDKLAEELSRLTTRDPITGLPNRQALYQGLEPLVSRSRRYNNPLSVIRIKMDNPDTLDEKHGAGCGERALLAVSQLLRDQVRWADMVGRLSDDEFLLILPETAEEAAKTLVDKLKSLLASLSVETGAAGAFKVAPRFGVASWKKGDDSMLLLKTASQEIDAQGEAA